MSTDTKALTETQKDLSPAEYRDRQEVAVIGKRIKAMLPGAEKLSDSQAMALAQYSMLLDANPFRGETYAYTDRHGFHLVDGYIKRIKRIQCPGNERLQNHFVERRPRIYTPCKSCIGPDRV